MMTFVKDYGNYIISQLEACTTDYRESKIRRICRIIKLHEKNQMSAQDSVKAISSIYEDSISRRLHQEKL